MHFSSVRLRSADGGSTGALASFLSQNARAIGHSHHLIWSLFEGRGPERDVVYRMTGRGPSQPVLIYSAAEVADGHGLWDVRTRPFDLADGLRAGDRLTWSLRVNAVRSANGPDPRPSQPEGAPKPRMRTSKHDIVTHARRSGDGRDWEAVAQRVVPPWLRERLARGGMDAPEAGMVVEAFRKVRIAHDPGVRNRDPIVVAMTDLRGSGTVTDPEALRGLLLRGIGSARAYGCGMLLIKRAEG